jgi:hypothetical protein
VQARVAVISPPTEPKAPSRRGKVNASTDAQNKFVATAHDLENVKKQ